MNNTFGCYLSILITLIFLFIYSIKTKCKLKSTIIVLIIFTVMFLTIKNNNTVIVKNNFSMLFYDINIISDYEKEKLIIRNNDIEKIKQLEFQMNYIGTSRMVLWKKSVEVILKHPIVGIGIENMLYYYFSNNIVQSRPHNMILQVATFIGIPGAVIYLIFIILIAFVSLKQILKEKDELMITAFFTVISYFISSMFGNSMFYTSPYFMIMLGVLICFINKYSNKVNINN